MLSSEQVRTLRQQVLDEIDAIESIRSSGDDAAAVVELDQTRVGRLSRMDALQAQAMSSAARTRREQRLRQLKRALARIDGDDYGECEDCGEDINPDRLAFDPAATRCIDCAEAAGA